MCLCADPYGRVVRERCEWRIAEQEQQNEKERLSHPLSLSSLLLLYVADGFDGVLDGSCREAKSSRMREGNTFNPFKPECFYVVCCRWLR